MSWSNVHRVPNLSWHCKQPKGPLAQVHAADVPLRLAGILERRLEQCADGACRCFGGGDRGPGLRFDGTLMRPGGGAAHGGAGGDASPATPRARTETDYGCIRFLRSFPTPPPPRPALLHFACFFRPPPLPPFSTLQKQVDEFCHSAALRQAEAGGVVLKLRTSTCHNDGAILNTCRRVCLVW